MEDIAVTKIKIKAVPTANLASLPKKINNGTARKPPPNPAPEEKMPMTIPANAKVINFSLFFLPTFF